MGRQNKPKFPNRSIVSPGYCAPFVDLLACAANTNRLRTVLTLRADFYHRCVEFPRLAELLREGSFPLAAPELDALLNMIERPAVLARLKFDEGLPGRILRDTGREPGALALMAYTLDELYMLATTRGDHCLTFADYEKLGGVEKAIGTRAENIFAALDEEAQAALPHVFRELVEVDERGTVTRQRAPLSRFEGNNAAWTPLEKFTDARLLTTSGGDSDATIEVAHEALFRSWGRLAVWIETAQDDPRLLRQVRLAAQEWDENEHQPAFLWPDERLKPVYAMQKRLQPDLDPVTQDFIRPEAERLLKELEDINTPHKRRSAIGERLDAIGDPRPGVGLRKPSPLAPLPEGKRGRGLRGEGLPDIVWCYVDVPEHLRGKKIEFIDNYIDKHGEFEVKPFYSAKYPITFMQFQAFLDDPDGFERDEWWEGLTKQYRKQAMHEQYFKFANHPRENVSWYDAVAFCHWLTAKLPPEAWPEETLTPWPPLPQGEGKMRQGEGEKFREMARQTMVKIARDLRRRTDAESLLWECLRDRRLGEIKFRRQHPVAETTYVVDFFNYASGLIVEIDGPVHDRQHADALARQQHLEHLGYRVLRFTNDQVFSDLETVLAQIVAAAKTPLPEGEGQRGRG